LEVDVPTKRHRRARAQEHSEAVRALLAHEPLERTAETVEALQELVRHPFEGVGAAHPQLCGWALAQLERWERETQ
jgi:hypothetical protein